LRTGLGVGPLLPPLMRLLLLPILVAAVVVDADWFLGLGLTLGEGVEEEAPMCGLDPTVGLISGTAAVKLPPPPPPLLVVGVLGKLFAAKFDAEPPLDDDEVFEVFEVFDGDRKANGSSTFPVIILVVVVVDEGKDERGVFDIKLDPIDVCGNGLLDPTFDDLKELAGLREAGIIGDDVNDLWRADGDDVDGGGGITPLLMMVPILCDKFSDIRALAASVASKLNGPILSK
jgi:hypothetical protein